MARHLCPDWFFIFFPMKNTLNWLLLGMALLLGFNLFISIGCKKNPPAECNGNDLFSCKGDLSCVDGVCKCALEDYVKYGEIFCLYRYGYTYQLNSNLDGLFPDTFLIGLVRPDAISGEIGEVISNGMHYKYSGILGRGPMTDYKHTVQPPAGLVNDGFRFWPAGMGVYPPNGTDPLRCEVRFEGTFIHPDTIRATARLISCDPSGTTAGNRTFAVDFIRVYPE
jgi:hypothetical protein